MNRRRLLALAAFAFAVPALAAARTYQAGALNIGQPWARPAAAGRTGAGYLSITNTGARPDTLVAASTAAATRVTIHEMQMSGSVMRMRAISGLTIAPGATVTLAPGGYHLMFEGLKRDLRLGERVPGVLTFARAGKVNVDFVVQAAPPDAGHHDHM